MSKEITIFYGTETGNSQDLAEKSESILNEEGYNISVLSLEDANPDDLLEIQLSLFIVSTWGEGDPPLDAEDFYETLKLCELELSNLNYGIMGLGDRSYEIFNGFARDLDTTLSKLGAKRIGERIEADLDYDDDFVNWISEMRRLIG
ncbi:MAG: flavodoxin domain-containing protein [Verrucomicrobiota bacterium]|jgi:sulfite reductase (NADPH) flavoprotein alpha-component|nr:flavodoxin domain-containing protein [Verrucomicrobiota bacterium]